MVERNGAGTGSPRFPGTDDDEPVLGDLIGTTTHDLLDYFEKCPSCGYAAQASVTTRAFSRGVVERRLFRTCGLPCGWHVSTAEVVDAVPLTHCRGVGRRAVATSQPG
ncbi:hypothetical protein ACFWM1_13150 [Nocardia sp. NPDC058379]|uniref:hypothetical protein n=1 Tax=unclassified Nocardia TaxID=2637762 RepID=UPI0036675EFC